MDPFFSPLLIPIPYCKVMDLTLFKGLCAGFFYTFISISAMILVAHYITQKSAKAGLFAAFGIVTMQFVWALIASLIFLGLVHGINLDSSVFTLIGSIILFIMALKIYRGREKYDQKDPIHQKPFKIFAVGLLLALAFPIRIAGYAAIFGAINISPVTPMSVLIPSLGVALGSLLWWLIFTLSIHSTRKMISPKTLQQFHLYAALILVLFSFIGLSRLFL